MFILSTLDTIFSVQIESLCRLDPEMSYENVLIRIEKKMVLSLMVDI